MSVKTNKKPWSISLVWSYIIGVTATFFLMPVMMYLIRLLLQIPDTLEGIFKLEDWVILLLLLVPVVFIVKRNRLLFKALAYSFLIYSCIGVFILLITGSVGWGGVSFFRKFTLYILGVGLIGAFCTLMTFLCDKLLSRNKALS